MPTRQEWNAAAADAVATIARMGRPTNGHVALLSAILAGPMTSAANYAAAAVQLDRIEDQRKRSGRRAHLERIGR